MVDLEEHMAWKACGGALEKSCGVFMPSSLAVGQHHLGAWHVSFGVECFSCVDLLVRNRLLVRVYVHTILLFSLSLI